MRTFISFFLLVSFSCGRKDNTRNLAEEDKIADYILEASKAETQHSRKVALVDSAFRLTRHTVDSKEAIEKVLLLTDLYIQVGQTTKAVEAAKLAEKKARFQKDTLQMVKSRYLIGRAFMFQSQNDSAYLHLNSAKKLAVRKNYEKVIILSYLSLSELFYYTCDFIELERAAMTLVQYARRFESEFAEHLGYNWLGISANELCNYEEADAYFDKALPFFEKDPYYKSYILHCKGFNYYKSGSLSKAVATFKSAISELNAPSKNPEIYARLIDDLTHTKFLLNQYDSLPFYLLSSQNIRDRYSIESGRNFNRLYLSKYYSKIGQNTIALGYAEEALRLSESFKAPRDVLQCLKQLIVLDKSKSLEYTQRYITLSDSLQLAERRNRNKFARIAFESDELTAEKDRAIKQKWIVIGVAGVILLLGGLLFVIKMQRAKQKRLMLVHEQQKADEAIYQLINDQQLKIDEGRQAEKKRIAQELHDGIMNRLASTRLNLFMLNKSQDDATIKRCLGFIGNIQEIEHEIRQVAHDLNHEIFSENKGFVVLLETLFEEYRGVNSTKLFTEIDSAFNWEMTESALRMNIYRILQEALQNSYKYANAKNIFVTLTKEDTFVRILVHDDGIGFKPTKVKKGLGLQNIADRVKSLQGEFKIISGGPEGTILNILLPLTRQDLIVDAGKP